MRQLLAVAALGALGACATASADVGASAPAGVAHVRIAHRSADAPAVDVCLAPHGSGRFERPVLASHGIAWGVAYGAATPYVAVPSDRYDVRLVAPASRDCETPLAGLPDVVDLPALADGAAATIAAEGLVRFGSPTPLALAVYVDPET